MLNIKTKDFRGSTLFPQRQCVFGALLEAIRVFSRKIYSFCKIHLKPPGWFSVKNFHPTLPVVGLLLNFYNFSTQT